MFKLNPFTGEVEQVGGNGTVTNVSGGVGITGTPEPVVAGGTFDLDLNSLTTEAALASGDLFAFVDVSVGTIPAAQRKITVGNFAAGINGLLDHGLTVGLGDDDHGQYTKKAGRAGSTNDTTLSTSAAGILSGSSSASFGLQLQASTAPDGTASIGIQENLSGITLAAGTVLRLMSFLPASAITASGTFNLAFIDVDGSFLIGAPQLSNQRQIFTVSSSFFNTPSGTARSLGLFEIFTDGVHLNADGAACTVARHSSFFSTPDCEVLNGGTLTISELNSFDSAPSLGPGATATVRRGLYVRNAGAGGNQPTAIGVDVVDQTSAGAFTAAAALRSAMAAGTNKWALLGTGSAVSSLVGGLRLGDNTAPVGMLEVSQATLGGLVARLESIATNDDPRCDWAQGRVATTNATPAVLAPVALNPTETVLIEAHVTARRTGGTAGTAEDGATYVLRAHVDRGGALSLARIVNVQQSFVSEHQAAWDATIVLGADFISAAIQVTGAVNNNVTWHTTYKVMRVGT